MNSKKSNGMYLRITKSSNRKNTFVEIVSRFEYYLSDLAYYIYESYTNRLLINSKNDDLIAQNKLLKVIVEKETKEEMIEYIITEKLRSIFYGNPTDFFLKDKCKLEFGNIFKDVYNKEIQMYAKVVGKRNLVVHNQSRIDIKDTRDRNLEIGKKIYISDDYIRGTIGLLEGLAAKATECAIVNVLKGNTDGKLKSSLETFERARNRDWFNYIFKE